ncbi:phosphatase PAP2 family protein [Psychroserpens damuponensis]|uniref:phosphatase PAP2 family protein n=1 Tax=Psychroserpens damuponensis TaxID=943936 RepID=UPI000A580C33|nr:phosphatase PAP2 family protein [Psychroserpens damuponensis]
MVSQTIVNTKLKDSSSIWDLMKHDAKFTVKSVAHSLSRPAQWKGKDYKKLGILVAGTATLSLADQPLRDWSQENRTHFPKILRDFGWYFGSPQNYFAVNTGLYTFGLLTKNEKVRKTSVLIISSSFTTGLIQTLTKTTVGRARPGSGFNNYTFNPFSGEATYRSFPSGHTILSMTMAHSIAKQFDNTWVKVGIYSIGAIPPISRVIDDAHWITDIAFSTALSIIVVDCIDNYLFKEDAYDYPKKKKLISWNFRFSSNQIGIVGTF